MEGPQKKNHPLEKGETLPVLPAGDFSVVRRPGASQVPGGRIPDTEGAPRLESGAVLGGRFRVLRLLGRGGMGEVYLAEDLRLGRQVALKVLSPSLAHDPLYVQRFQREGRSASALNHPAVCVIHEIGTAEDAARSSPWSSWRARFSRRGSSATA
jgi:hypothetical protein